MEFDPSTPIWVQLTQELTRRIVTGDWPAGAKIPAVRELAVDLKVNPNTVQRALTELERSGLAQTVRTTGRFVSDDVEAIAAARGSLAADAATEYAQRASGLGMQLDAAIDLLGRQWPAATQEGEAK